MHRKLGRAEASTLALTKATDGYGIGIRRYRHQRVWVIKRLGRARPRDLLGACIKGDSANAKAVARAMAERDPEVRLH